MPPPQSNFKILKAYNGDCILINCFNSEGIEINILIDGGTASTFDYSLKKEINNLKKIDLIILTHIDADHIGGLIKLFKSSIIDKVKVNNIWVNFPDIIEVSSGEKISFGQAKTLENLIKEKLPNAQIKKFIHSEIDVINFEGIKITVISPTKEILNCLYAKWPEIKLSQKKAETSKTNISRNHEATNSIPLAELNKLPFIPDNSVKSDLINASSISIILECDDLKLLLLADSRPEIIEKYLNINHRKTKLSVDFVKVSHHGSKNNTSQEVLKYIESDNYIISTNGGSAKHKHPSRETIARIIYNEERDFTKKRFIYLNYPLDDIKNKIGTFINDDDLKDGNWEILNKNVF